MYAVAARLDPDTYLALARAAYAEMALAGVTASASSTTCTTTPAARRTTTRTRWAQALRAAAADAGIRLTLLDTCYLAGGLEPSGHLPLDPVQQRFGDGDVDAWAERVARCAGGRRAGRRGGPLGPRGAARRASPTVAEAAARPARCTCTCPSSRPRTRRAWRHYGLHPDRAAAPSRRCSARAPPPCTPPT